MKYKQSAREAYPYFFLERECDLVTVHINLALLQRKSCSVYMRVFEIVAHHNRWSYDIDIYFVFYGLHDTTLQICITYIPLYECFVNITI